MKKLLLTAALVAIFGFAASAQEQGEIRVGAGIAAGTRASVDTDNGESKLGLGINFGAEYLITDAISIAPSYTSYFKTDFGGGVSSSFSELNIDARYYFGESGVYGLVGFGSVTAKAEALGFSVSSSESGINIGGGIMLPLSDNLYANGQLKYNTVKIADAADAEGKGQIVINLGVAYSF